MYKNKSQQCPVAIFLLYNSKRPAELRNMGPVYFSVIDAPLTNIWFKI